MNAALARITARTAFVFGIAAIVAGAAYARTQTPGITFATNGIDLKIDSRAWYNGTTVPGSTWTLKNLVPTADHFFSYDDVKPGDSGKTVISMHVKKESAFLCLDFSNFDGADNTQNEPEAGVDGNGLVDDELADGVEMFGWIDDGDNVYEFGEKIIFGQGVQRASYVLNNKSYAIADSGQGGACGVNQTRYVGIAWCAGNLTVNIVTGAMTCDASTLGNKAQTDSFSFDTSIRAMPSKQHGIFSCGTKPPHHDDDDDDHGGGHDDGHGGDDDDKDDDKGHGTSTPRVRPDKPQKPSR